MSAKQSLSTPLFHFLLSLNWFLSRSLYLASQNLFNNCLEPANDEPRLHRGAHSQKKDACGSSARLIRSTHLSTEAFNAFLKALSTTQKDLT